MVEVAALPETKAPLLGRREVAEGTIELTFDFSEGPIGFTAGQYVSLIAPPEVGVDPPSDQRDLSIASSPEMPEAVSIAYRDSDSPVKRWLRGLPLGAQVTLRGPAGSFLLPDGDAPVAMVAGGIGVAPFRSMLHDSRQAERQFGLFCWNSNSGRIPYPDELARLTGGNRRELGLHTDSFEAEPLRPWQSEHPDSFWYVSGPSEMVWNVLAALDTLGVSKKRIRTEEFTGYEDRPDG